MRRLAAEVGVTPMALYQRFENRQALLDAVAAAALADLEVPVPATGTWDDRLVAWATGVRHHLVALGDLLTVVGGSERLAAAMLRASDQALALMTELGYDDAAAVAAFRSVFWHAVGSALARPSMTTRAPEALRLALTDVPGDDLPNFVDLLGHFGALDPDELFEHSTRLLATGLRAGAPSPPGASQ